ncbi:LRR receptor-like serine threonine-protein kinase [Seminavis robusta]|uniref:LRR receptor-like serine threonine-protein kinase n=1 Tax=Seminavis robusta TaxID=568900 RepID=A0A9N8HQ95_9STRA|nr:LRR receptor-like serine threonine-protein kinase [Seminavis robusta]|eukprot:Sro964_g225490.1 LRR receptor-like serine threonine-protein kinase (652) ;mRNA; r:35876-38250
MEARLQDSGLYQGEDTATPEQDNTRIELVDTNTNVAPEDTVQNDNTHGIMPLPPLERTMANRRAQVQPGAYPGGGNQATEENLEPAETDIEPTTTGPPTGRIEPEIENSGLAVANLIQDETTPQDLPQAQDYNLENENTNREERMKQFKTKVLLGVIVLLAIILILVAILIPRRQENGADIVPTPMPSELPRSNPSQGPSSYSEYWLSLFPESTVAAIQENPESPQSMAFEWLVEEIDILHNLTEQRVVQRFVLATFYFANSEQRWYFSDSWLNHSVHECLWYSGLEDWYFFFEANIYFPLDHIGPCEQDPAGYLEDGILYQGDGIIKHFWLSFNGMVGSGIPPEFYMLTELRSLALDGFDLTGTIPEELSGLANLEYVSMNDCGLYGSIPETIGQLANLEHFYLGFNSLTGTIPSSLYALTNSMRGIVLTENLITGPGLFLNNLILSGSIPDELAVLTDMVLVGTIPSWLGNLKSLDSLLLERSSFTGTIPTELGLLTKLGSLWLGVNILSGTILSEFGLCEEVIWLNMEINDLTGTIPTELGLLTHGLLQLFLHDNDLTGTVPLELGNVPFPAPYGQVYLHGNDLSGIIPESLCSANDLTFDCSSQLCGCDWCNCSDNRTSLILEEETTNEDDQLLSGANQTEGNQTEA